MPAQYLQHRIMGCRGTTQPVRQCYIHATKQKGYVEVVSAVMGSSLCP